MTIDHLSTDALCVLFKLAVLPPDTVLRKTQVETVLGLFNRGITHALQPLLDRGWIEGMVSKGYTLTPSGTEAVRGLLLLANQSPA